MSKFKEGKLKDLTLPQLKAFITSRKVGKASQRKDELLAMLDTYLKAQ